MLVSSPASDALLAHSFRSGVEECRFYGSAVALRADGSVAWQHGDPERPVFGRSANKPLQAEAMYRLGLAIPDRQMALVCASHSGTSVHVELCQEILHGAGCTEANLRNAVFPPYAERAREELYRRNGSPSRLTGDCSGKHAGMLATCVINGWDLDSYLAVDHPLQRAITALIAEYGDVVEPAIGVDGCGAPAHIIPLSALARSYARLAKEHGQIYRSMVNHPDVVGGPGRDVTRLMDAIPGLMAKDGADGVFAAAMPDGRVAAVKISDGALSPRVPVLLAGLAAVGVDVSAADHLRAVTVFGGGAPVGEISIVTGLA